MIKLAIVGYGNVGYHALKAALRAPDMEVVAVVRRNPSPHQGIPPSIPVIPKLENMPVDVALLTLPSRQVPEKAEALLQQGISTVDSFDIHEEIPRLRSHLDGLARTQGKVAIIGAGWDPGTDSVIRVLMEAMAPWGLTFTNFGPGISMGHSVAVRSLPGVRRALSYTLPLGFGRHRRLVYVEKEERADEESIREAILKDPYFRHDPTEVIFVPSTAPYEDYGHGVCIERKGTSGETANQRFSFSMAVHNPSLTGQIMVAAARAAVRQRPGAYTLPEIPPVDLLPGERGEIIQRLV